MNRIGLVATVVLSVSTLGCEVMDPVPGIHGSTTDLSCVDEWTFAHLASGAALGRTMGRDGFAPSVAVLVGFEGIEPHFWPGWCETNSNQQCDIAAGLLGWFAAVPGAIPYGPSSRTAISRRLR